MKIICKFLKHEEGAIFVEMAAVIPFVMLLAFGMFEFGNVLNNHHLINTGLRDAGRYLARYPGDDKDPVSYCDADPLAGDLAAGEARARRIAVTGSPLPGGDYRVSWWDEGDILFSYLKTTNLPSGGGVKDYNDCDDVYTIHVTTTVSYPGLGFLDFLGIGPTLDFTMDHEERYMRR